MVEALTTGLQTVRSDRNFVFVVGVMLVGVAGFLFLRIGKHFRHYFLIILLSLHKHKTKMNWNKGN